MDVGSMVNQGLIGMQRSQTEMTRSAEQITQAAATPAVPEAPGGDTPRSLDVIEPLINIQAQQQVFDSSAKVVKAGDEMLGQLIDLKA